MDPNTFSKSMQHHAGNLVSELYNFPDVPRKRVHDILICFEKFLQQQFITSVFSQMTARLTNLGECEVNVDAYKSMIGVLQTPFFEFRNEYQSFQYFKLQGTYIEPEEVKVCVKSMPPPACPLSVISENTAVIQFIPLRTVLKKFFELPGVFNCVMSYLDELEEYTSFFANIVQSEMWKCKKKSSPDKLMLPLLLYQDDFENNNPLGSHKGVGKVGAVYIILPCLPPQLLSKTENIFLLTLYKSDDENSVPLQSIFSKAIQGLLFLANEGIEVTTDSGLKKIYFSLTGVTGDNLAIHTLLGFVKSFSGNHPCRFCLISKKEMQSVFDASSCQMRSQEMYDQQLKDAEPKETGIDRPSVLGDLSPSLIEMMTVDPMHDILEGIGECDLGSVLHHFIVVAKYFTLEQLNARINDLNYGADEKRNKPREIKISQIKNKHVKMSAAESLCLLRNVGILIGEFIPEGDKYWKVIIKLKEIIDVVTAPVVHVSVHLQLETLISDYLSLLTSLFPGCIKPKHHLSITRRY